MPFYHSRSFPQRAASWVVYVILFFLLLKKRKEEKQHIQVITANKTCWIWVAHKHLKASPAIKKMKIKIPRYTFIASKTVKIKNQTI